ncbi:MAG: hypothetical protein R3C02_16515 [Planctomycetaceae bacterium]
MGLVGKEAVMAWRVDEGRNGTSLEGLGVAVVAKAEGTLGEDGIFPDAGWPYQISDPCRRAGDYGAGVGTHQFCERGCPENTLRMSHRLNESRLLENDHHSVEGVFQAGIPAEIHTRKLAGNDCVCTNEEIYFQPLTDVYYATPAYTLKQKYLGEGSTAVGTTQVSQRLWPFLRSSLAFRFSISVMT